MVILCSTSSSTKCIRLFSSRGRSLGLAEECETSAFCANCTFHEGIYIRIGTFNIYREQLEVPVHEIPLVSEVELIAGLSALSWESERYVHYISKLSKSLLHPCSMCITVAGFILILSH
ncbi:hypothetical protein CEXT_108481 [Caerostris extrusa]|uniref:Uncharacterized protein n=1 Tax=Caerostris extrusa TaxID=172846 RepID=A0AAV4SQF1_CAEEX|nr:hypothetical protein CEXT_108481 [Caerostris extrusa]